MEAETKTYNFSRRNEKAKVNMEEKGTSVPLFSAEGKGRRIFKGTSDPKDEFFYRKVSEYGNSRMLALSRIIPANWKYVRVRKVESDENYVVVKIEKVA